MFSYISAWNYKRRRREEDSQLIIDSFGSKETIAWRDLTKFSKISVVTHGDEVHPLISFADIIAFLTDVKLYNAEIPNRKLNAQNLEKAWSGVFDVDCAYIDSTRIKKIAWINNDHIDFSKYLLKPTIFFISDDISAAGINEEVTSVPDVSMKKGKRMMALEPVKNAIDLAARKGYSFKFYDPYIDVKNVSDGDIVVYMGEKSKQLAKYLEDGFDVKLYRAKDVKRELSSLHDC